MDNSERDDSDEVKSIDDEKKQTQPQPSAVQQPSSNSGRKRGRASVRSGHSCRHYASCVTGMVGDTQPCIHTAETSHPLKDHELSPTQHPFRNKHCATYERMRRKVESRRRNRERKREKLETQASVKQQSSRTRASELKKRKLRKR